MILNENRSILEAKNQARNEILKVFGFDTNAFANSERLNIFGDSKGDAILLSVSSILQGNCTVAALSKLLADFISDMKEDGVLNNTLIGSTLKGQAITLNCEQIEQNLLKQSAEIGLDVNRIVDFKDYVDYFIENSNFSFTSPFSFPELTGNGLNVLDFQQVEFQINTNYSFAAEMPGTGSLIIKMKKISGEGIWWYQPFHVQGWNVNNFENNEQTFTSTLNNVTIDLPIGFSGSGVALVEYYYNGATSPSDVKTINWGGENNSKFVYPENSPMGANLLALNDSSTITNDTTYIVGLQSEGTWDVNFSLVFPPELNVEVLGGYGEYEYSGLESPITFVLSGSDEFTGLSEIVFKFRGTGILDIISSDLNSNGSTYFQHIKVE